MRLILHAMLAAIIATAVGADTPGARPVLVELFTSQGCGSCPPADAYMHELAARDDVIALALHVDYWDYLFDDVFGKPAHTARQYGYAEAEGRRMVYTPQMIIDGREDVVGNRPKDVDALIARRHAAPQNVALELQREDDHVTISARALGGLGDGPLIVQLARFIPSQDVTIDQGENEGHTFTYANIVTDLTELGQWDTSAPLVTRATAEGDAPVVVILQRPDFGPIEAAALSR